MGRSLDGLQTITFDATPAMRSTWTSAIAAIAASGQPVLLQHLEHRRAGYIALRKQRRRREHHRAAEIAAFLGLTEPLQPWQEQLLGSLP